MKVTRTITRDENEIGITKLGINQAAMEINHIWGGKVKDIVAWLRTGRRYNNKMYTQTTDQVTFDYIEVPKPIVGRNDYD